MLDWLNFRLGEIIGLIHALERDIIKIKHSCVITLAQYMLRNFVLKKNNQTLPRVDDSTMSW